LNSKIELETIFWEVLTFLHQTYLSEVTRGIIPAAIFNPTTPKPEAKKYDKTLSDEVL